jgi:tetratricopeptide (TPR) repeat protein
MNTRARIILYAGLILCAVVFASCFSHENTRVSNSVASASNSRMMGYLGGLICVIVALGLIGAYDIVHFMGDSTEELLFTDAEEEKPDPEYLAAEQVRADGEPLEAIRLLREYCRKNPRDTNAAVRIAEIYDKDLKNHLAAVLEYEEVLKLKLPPDRWGWSAIRLCNLYSKLGQPDKTVALLRRIAKEYGDTTAAVKARERLAKIDPDFGKQPTGEKLAQAPPKTPPASAAPPASNLPPGFRPKDG